MMIKFYKKYFSDTLFDNQLIDNNKNSYNSSWSSNIETSDDETEFSDYDGLSI